MADTFDLKLRNGNELDLSGGQLNLIGGAAWVRQAIQTSLSLVRGEWFLDPTLGMPYFDQVLVKNPNLSLVRSVFKKAILAVPHVTGLPTLNLSFNRAARELSLSFVATTDLGLVSGSWPATGDVPAVPTVTGIAGTVISGSADPGSMVTVLVDGVVSTSATVGANGSWAVDVAGLAPGSAVTVRSGTSAESAPVYVPVPAPTITSPVDGFSYIVVPPPGYADSWTSIEVIGRALPNAYVEAELLDADGVRVGGWGGRFADADGNFSFNLLGNLGANMIQAQQTVNGIDSPLSAPVHVTGVVIETAAYVISGYSSSGHGQLLWSHDASSWDQVTLPQTDVVVSVTVNPATGIWVAAFSSGANDGSHTYSLISSDGKTWNPVTLPGPGYPATFYCVKWVPFLSLYVMVGSKILTSQDGSTWIDRTPTGFPTSHQLSSIAFSGTKVLARGGGMHGYASTDGVTWTAVAQGTGILPWHVAYGSIGGDLFASVAGLINYGAATGAATETSTDSGTTEIDHTAAIPAGSYAALTYMSGDPPHFVAVGSNVAAYSADGGATYTGSTIGAYLWNAITVSAYLGRSDGRLLAVGNDGSNGPGRLAVSLDRGATWTVSALPFSGAFFSIATTDV